MRTVKRHTLPLNQVKLEKLGLIVDANATEKQHWLVLLRTKAYRGLIGNHRIIRDQAVKEKYQSVGGLQARMWKLALTDACETMDKYFQSRFDAIKKKIYNKPWSDNQKHYAYWLLSDYPRLFSLLDDVVPAFDSNKRIEDIDHSHAKTVVNFVRKSLTALLKKQPKVNKARSFVLDSSCYSFHLKGKEDNSRTQYLTVMGLEAGKRIAIPLKGRQKVSGTIRIVTDDKVNYRVHVGFDVKTNIMPDDAMDIEALDFGYTEVATNQHGKRYGVNLGEMLTTATDDRTDKGRKRNKLRAVANKAYAKGDVNKAKRIKNNNLGQVKWKAREQDVKGGIDREVNTAFNQLNAKLLITEELTHVFSHKDICKKVNYRLSSWVKGSLRKRSEFKALVKGFDHKTVNAAYTSQTCPICGSVHKKNRIADKFKCTNCAFEGQADQVAAMNLVERYHDQEITRYMPHGVVKQILTARFLRSVEGKMKAGQSSTQKPDCNEQDTRNGAEKALTSAVSRKAKAAPVRHSVSECEFNTNAALTDVGRK
jgi:transposase